MSGGWKKTLESLHPRVGKRENRRQRFRARQTPYKQIKRSGLVGLHPSHLYLKYFCCFPTLGTSKKGHDHLLFLVLNRKNLKRPVLLFFRALRSTLLCLEADLNSVSILKNQLPFSGI